MLTAGVDLSAEPKGTALAVVEWGPGLAQVTDLQVGVPDEPIVAIASQANKIGIDCALGWPQEFVNFMVEQANPSFSGHSFDGGMDWRRRLAYRDTDRQVREITGRWPLSVSTDRLGLTAMRCAGLLSKLSAAGVEIDRSGARLVAEVYPGASLRLWGFDTAGYRASEEARARLISTLKTAAPWLETTSYEDQMVSSSDAFDAVVAALATRAVAVGRYLEPTAEQHVLALQEGWIALPQGSFASLVNPSA